MNFKHGERTRKGLEAVMGDLVHLGYGNFVRWPRVVGIFPARGAEGSRLRAQAQESGRLLDVTCGRRELAAILTDSEHVLLAAKDVAALWQMIEAKRQGAAND